MEEIKTIKLTRASVAMGDDCDAPHEVLIKIGIEWTIERILKTIIELDYLPRISGGKATWSVASNQPLAVIAQEWKSPKLICWPDYPNQGTKSFYNIQRLHFNYHAQDNPEKVFEVLHRFRTV